MLHQAVISAATSEFIIGRQSGLCAMSAQPKTSQGSDTATQSLRSFAVLWSGQAVSLIGSRLVRFAIVWWLTAQTGSATVLAMFSIAAMLPPVLLSPFIGPLVDRWSRRKIMIAADSITASSIGVLAYLYLMGTVEVWHIIVIMTVGSTSDTFHQLAMTSSTTLMVPQKHLGRVGGMNQTLNGVAGIMAPPLGALLLQFLPMAFILAIDILTGSVAVAIVLSIRIPQPPSMGHTKTMSVLSNMIEGFRYVIGWRPAAIIVLASMLVNLLVTPAFSLLPLLVMVHFRGDANAYAVVQSVLSVGLVLGGLLLGAWGGGSRRMVTGLLALIPMGVGTLAVSWLPGDAFLIALLLFFLIGFSAPIMNGCTFAVLQSTVPPEIQGRVFSILGSLSGAMIPAGLAVAGPIADLFGVQVWFLAAGLACIMMSITTLSIQSVRDIERARTAVSSQSVMTDT